MTRNGPVLVVAAHPDDEVLGCGGYLAALADAGRPVHVLLLPDNRLDTVDLLDIVQRIEVSAGRVQPETVLTHHHADVNVDHTRTHEAVLAAFRPLPGVPWRELLLFEVPSSTEWRPGHGATAFAPNLFVDITATMERKKRALQAYADELRPFPHPRSLEGVEALATWRGATAGVARAEAFVLARELRQEPS